MNVININDVAPGTNLTSIDDLAMFLNLMYHEVVDVILEYITIYTDTELIQEIINILNLKYTCVVESTTNGPITVGYIRGNAS
ncbi:MAG: hypothetical protein IJ743_04525 [Bacilli bacterium]|nr:hypothetical protein [Bacilli bacterium]